MRQEKDLSGRADEAARLVAEDTLTDEQIAETCKIHRATLDRWKKTPEFQARVKVHLEAQYAAVMATGIANKQLRVGALHDRWQRMKRVIAERAADPYLANVPGGTTGLVVKQVKNVGGTMVEEYGVDVPLLKEMRAHEEQAAKEVGQWVDKADVTTDGQPFATIADIIQRAKQLANGNPPATE